MRKVLVGLLGVLAGLAIALVVFFAIGSPVSVQDGETTYTTDVIANKIEEISELAVLEYAYKDAASLDTESSTVKLFNTDIKIPFSEKRLIVTYEGMVKMGPDMSQAKVELNNDQVKVLIPHSKILSHELDEESFEYLIQDSGLFNPLTPEDGGELRKTQKNVIEASIEEKGLLNDADEKAIKQIEAILGTFAPDLQVSVEIG